MRLTVIDDGAAEVIHSKLDALDKRIGELRMYWGEDYEQDQIDGAVDNSIDERSNGRGYVIEVEEIEEAMVTETMERQMMSGRQDWQRNDENLSVEDIEVDRTIGLQSAPPNGYFENLDDIMQELEKVGFFLVS
jgi:hypothetical protein